MKKSIYIFSNGEIQRKDNTLFFESEDGNRKYIPVEDILPPVKKSPKVREYPNPASAPFS